MDTKEINLAIDLINCILNNDLDQTKKIQSEVEMNIKNYNRLSFEQIPFQELSRTNLNEAYMYIINNYNISLNSLDLVRLEVKFKNIIDNYSKEEIKNYIIEQLANKNNLNYYTRLLLLKLAMFNNNYDLLIDIKLGD